MLVLTDDLPGDSVLRRHTLTERGRMLGMPPTDAVLRRHFEQLQAAVQGVMPAAPAAAQAVRPAPVTSAAQRSTAPAPATAAAAVTAAPVAAAGGGFFGWLRRLLGG